MMKKAKVMTSALAAGVAYVAAIPILRRWYTKWGAATEEIQARLPGDEFMHHVGSTRAVTIDAPVEEVWQWLVQIGQDRGGFYSYDWLENLIAADIHNTDHIEPKWQTLNQDDRVRLASKKLYGDR